MLSSSKLAHMPHTPLPSDPTNDHAKRAWQALTDTQTSINQNPRAIPARVAHVRAIIGLGLRTFALHALERLSEQGIPDTVTHELNEAARALPDDRVSLDEREQTMWTNLLRLPHTLRPDERAMSAWRDAFGGITWLRASDGNIIRCDLEKGRVAHLQDLRGAAAKLLAPLLGRLNERPCRPILVEGFDPPWFVQTLLDAPAPESSHQFRQRILIAQQDPGEFYNGLACADLGEQFGDERVLWFVGQDATSRMRSWLLERVTVAPAHCVVRSPLVRESASPPIEQISQDVSDAWSSTRDDLIAQMVDPEKPRDLDHWKQRYTDAATDGTPLRVVVITSRFSTYIRHAAHDLCTQLDQSGHNATLLMEPDDFSVTTETYYLNAIREIDPDLIVTINYPRSMMRHHVPSDVPFVCWVQDAMPHIFDHDQGCAFGELDFMVGMVDRSLHEAFGYPSDRLRWLPMSASTEKFTADQSVSVRSCDIAWVSHHGASLEELHHQLLRGLLSGFPGAPEVLKAMPERIAGITSQPTSFVQSELAQLAQDPTLKAAFSTSPPTNGDALLRSYINQLAERAFRLETARWAVSIAQRRSWVLRLHGNGWDSNPEFRAFAAPPLTHGEELSRFYQRAGVHLHASLTQPLHQRVAECTFAGGLVLARVPRDQFSLLNDQAIEESVRLGIGHPLPDDPDARRAPIERLPSAKRLVAELRRLGLCDPEEYADGHLAWPGFKVRGALRGRTDDVCAHTKTFIGMTDLFFANEDTLELLLASALGDDAWRSEHISKARTVLSRTMSMRSFTDRLLGFVYQRLDAAPTDAAAPTR